MLELKLLESICWGELRGNFPIIPPMLLEDQRQGNTQHVSCISRIPLIFVSIQVVGVSRLRWFEIEGSFSDFLWTWIFTKG
jgi:hypothetical protein